MVPVGSETVAAFVLPVEALALDVADASTIGELVVAIVTSAAEVVKMAVSVE